jgi:site-specific DNA recombinase
VINLKVAIYIRVSTDEQATKGNSLVEQEERLRAYCKAMQWDDVDVYMDDGYSAKDLNRPKLQELLARIKNKEYGMFVTTKIDRLCRNLLDLLTIVDNLDLYQCGYVSVGESFDTSTAAGRLSLQILGAFAEFERQRNRERVRDNLQSLAKKVKKAITRPCFGYDVIDGQYVINEAEAEIVRQMTEWMLNGEGAHRVMRRLNDMGIKTKDGNSFTQDAVRKLMRRETLAGMFVYNRRYVHKGKELIRPENEWIVVENHHTPIIDKETFEKLQLAMNARRTAYKQADNERWLLSGLVYCTHCGNKMVGRHRKKPSGKEYFHYVCASYLKKAECFHHFVDRDELENKIINSLKSLSQYGIAKQSKQTKIQKSSIDIKNLESRLKKLDIKLQRQLELYEDGELSKADFITARNRIDKEREEIQSQLKLNSNIELEKFEALVSESKDDITSNDRLRQKRAVSKLLDRIEITDSSKVDTHLKWLGLVL